jgi:hypothetical protein
VLCDADNVAERDHVELTDMDQDALGDPVALMDAESEGSSLNEKEREREFVLVGVGGNVLVQDNDSVADASRVADCVDVGESDHVLDNEIEKESVCSAVAVGESDNDQLSVTECDATCEDVSVMDWDRCSLSELVPVRDCESDAVADCVVVSEPVGCWDSDSDGDSDADTLADGDRLVDALNVSVASRVLVGECTDFDGVSTDTERDGVP